MLTDLQVGVFYYGALAVSVLLGILGLVYLKPKTAIRKITGDPGNTWVYNFFTTVIIAGMLGAMSVSFTDCRGNYSRSLDKTIDLGLSQVSAACICLAILLGMWFMVLFTMKISSRWEPSQGKMFKLFGVGLVMLGLCGFYLTLMFFKS